jgi:hypothetical protein
MKKIIVSLLMLVFLIGCAGITANAPVNIAVDTAFYLTLKNNPQYKPVVVQGLNAVKVALSGSLTYDQLMAEIAKQFPGDAAAIGVIVSGYIATDKPISVTLIPMSAAYKQAILVEIDKFLLLASTIPG